MSTIAKYLLFAESDFEWETVLISSQQVANKVESQLLKFTKTSKKRFTTNS